MSRTELATRARTERGRLRLRLKRGEITLAEALDEPAAQKLTVEQVMSALPYSSKPKLYRSAYSARVRSAPLIERAGMDGDELIEDCGALIRQRLVDAYDGYIAGRARR